MEGLFGLWDVATRVFDIVNADACGTVVIRQVIHTDHFFLYSSRIEKSQARQSASTVVAGEAILKPSSQSVSLTKVPLPL